MKELKRIHNKDIIDFSSNINFAFPGKFILNSVEENLESIFSYPEIDSFSLKEKASGCLAINPENIIFGNGATELIYLILKSLSPRKLSITIPTFTEYERAARSFGIDVQYIYLEKETFSLPEFKRTDFLFICNPNNPTGNLLFPNLEELLKLGSFSFLIVDESFLDFLDKKEQNTIIYEAVKSKNILVLRSMTKFFAIPGLRLGYLVGKESTIRKLKTALPPWNVNALSQAVGERLFEFRDFDRINRKIAEERRFLFAKLKEIKGLKPYPSRINFFLVKILSDMSATKLRKKLIEKGILIRACSNIPGLGEKFIRITVLAHDKNIVLLKYLQEILA